jgi:hypothetical protein
MLKIFFLFFFLSASLSCYHENKEAIPVPEKLLNRAQMVDIITDLQISEGILTYKRIEKIPVKGYGEALYNKVIEEHQVTRQQLQENIDFYNEDPKLMEKIYDEVLARLNKIQSEIMIEAAKRDSLATHQNDSIQIQDSIMLFQFVNFVSIIENDTLKPSIDTPTKWVYKDKIKIPGFIY